MIFPSFGTNDNNNNIHFASVLQTTNGATHNHKIGFSPVGRRGFREITDAARHSVVQHMLTFSLHIARASTLTAAHWVPSSAAHKGPRSTVGWLRERAPELVRMRRHTPYEDDGGVDDDSLIPSPSSTSLETHSPSRLLHVREMSPLLSNVCRSLGQSGVRSTGRSPRPEVPRWGAPSPFCRLAACLVGWLAGWLTD